MESAIATRHPQARFSYSLTYNSGAQETILFGGFAPGVKFDDTWSWNGYEWNLITDEGPSARDSAAITYDSKNKVVLLLGGHLYDDRFVNDFWELKTDQWQPLNVTCPPARNHASMIYVPHIDKTILFGGRTKTEDLGDTWAWNGGKWQELYIQGPSPRDGYRMAYDSMRKKVVLFGGRSRAGNMESKLADTWEFDGNAWAQVSDTGPEPRSHYGMFFDQASNKVLLFGGESSFSSYFNDFWSWDGTRWERSDISAPTPRSRIFMSHQTNGKVITFGGNSESGPLSDTWEWSASQSWKDVSFQDNVKQTRSKQEVK